MSFKKFLKEYLKTLKENITKNQLDLLEQYLDQIFSKIGIDIEFTRHFHDRLNDKRNIKPITLGELAQVFKDLYTKYGKKITELGDDIEAVLNHMRTDINIPFVLNHNKKDGSFELVSKTIMRKPDFKTSNPKIKI
jgi:hypothetical protein